MTTTADTGRRRPQPQAGGARPLVVLVGNPNTGKTTLFNRLTGQNARVGNYPGVTVERLPGFVELPPTSPTHAPRTIEVVDVPGAYSLTARSAEEQIAINAVLGLGNNPRPALVVVVVDAGQLTRNLYLVLQLAELEVPMIVVLNMIDEVEDNPPSPAGLSHLFDVPVVATNARKGIGVTALKATIAGALDAPPDPELDLPYPPALLADAEQIVAALPSAWRSSPRRDRALALWALTSIERRDELRGIDANLRERCLAVHRAAGDRDIDQEVIATRYAFLDRHVPGLLDRADEHPPKHPLSERVDRILLHPAYGFAALIALMFVVFQALFSWADPAIGLIEEATGQARGWLAAGLPAGVVTDLLTDGIIGGVGNVVVFLPQILLLFFFIGLLEDSGYMARVAFLIDRIMRALGLHGRAFVPMLSGLACAVPAILATRTMERHRDRLLTMLVIPLMTCSARLPVYTLIIAALFPQDDARWPVQGTLMVGMYVFSIATTLAAAAVLSRTVVSGSRTPLILELPPYRLPAMRTILRAMVGRAGIFLREAGTVILVCTVVLWGLLTFPRSTPPATSDGAAGMAPEQARLANSWGGRLGHALEPALAPLGFDWKIGVGLVGAFAAREVFISTMGIIYGVGDSDDDPTPLRERIRAERRADGTPVYTPLVGLSLMVFFALACQCMSTLAVTRRETRSWRWPVFMFAYMTALAWVSSFVVYQGGRLLGL